MSPPSEPRVLELLGLLWDKPRRGSAAMTISTKLKEANTGSVLGRMEVFQVKILLNIQFKHLGPYFFFIC